jgi:hypothetical protein
VARLGHLTRRFFGSLRPGGPPRSELVWVDAQLLDREVDLWRQMSGPDRRHAVVVARRVERSLGHEASREVLAAALLHDVGKTQSGLGTYGRVIATLSGAAVGHDTETIKNWTRTRGFTRRVGLYLQHPKLGGDLLGMAGSDPLTEQWAREHHLPPDEWTVPADIAVALHEADDD